MTRAPRGVEERIDWFLTNYPNKVGMCAQHSWHALGGDYGNPPPWGCRNANEVYAKVTDSGDFGTGIPPRGALVLWRYGRHGHAAISLGNGRIATTDPCGKPGRTGIEDLNYPVKWGATRDKWIWTRRYNTVGFAVGEEEPWEPVVTDEIDSSLLGSGQPPDGKPVPTLRELQHRLNSISLQGGRKIAITGVFDAATEFEVRLWQRQTCGDKPDPNGRVSLGPKQRKRMFPTPPYTILDKGLPQPPTAGPEPEWATRLRRALARVTAQVDFRPRWTDPAIAGKHTWNPSWVVLHHTAGTNSLRWIEDGADHPPVPAAHFLIDRDGTVHVFSCHETYHAGSGGPLGDVPADRMNSHAWGIEIESQAKRPDFTAAQVESAVQLCAGLIEHAGVIAGVKGDDPWRVINHSTWNDEKIDTFYGDGWWRDRIVAELTGTSPQPPDEEEPESTINVADLRYGTEDSSSVAWWQRRLNAVKLVGGSSLPESGNYLDGTKRVTALWQEQRADDKSVTDGSCVTLMQARQMDPYVVLIPDGDISPDKWIHYHFGRKSPGKQPLKTSYVPLDDNPDCSSWRAPEDGLMLSTCYLTARWAEMSDVTAQLRVRLMCMDSEEPMLRQDYTVGGITTVNREFVAEKVWFGWADKGCRYQWQVDSAGFRGAHLTTRFTKWVLIPTDTLKRVAQTMGFPVESVIAAGETMFKTMVRAEFDIESGCDRDESIAATDLGANFKGAAPVCQAVPEFIAGQGRWASPAGGLSIGEENGDETLTDKTPTDETPTDETPTGDEGDKDDEKDNDDLGEPVC